MEKKKNSIDWLLKKIWWEYRLVPNDDIIEEAKAMHKEEVQDAWLNGMKGEMIAPFAMNRYKPEAQEYYNETFGNVTIIKELF